MSTSYDIVCAECNDSTYFEDCRHLDALCAVLRRRASFDSVAAAILSDDLWWFRDHSGPGEIRLTKLVEFLAKHLEHSLAVRDEYGTFHAH